MRNNKAKNGGAVNTATYQVAWNGVITAAIGTNQNVIAWSNKVSGAGQAFYGNTNTVLHSDVQGEWTGAGGNNLSKDPIFFKAFLSAVEASRSLRSYRTARMR